MYKFLLSSLIFLCMGCSASNAAESTTKSAKMLTTVSSKAEVSNLLEESYIQWKGTPYRYGGSSRKGIDCSAFTSAIIREKFKKSSPRTVAEQAKVGKKIAHKDAVPGDLVFFKTGKNRLHVGIYYKNNYFLHVSTSKGVSITSLDTPYWKNRYWQTRRIM